ncbi:hypothetical protein OAH95_02970 [Burkholderiaceae bacterium]|nr:hypothetical protein [Burkholderiaceae bacterium]
MIYQFNVSYVSVEDRLLFKISTTDALEYRLWLTRALVEKTLNLLVPLMDAPEFSRVTVGVAPTAQANNQRPAADPVSGSAKAIATEGASMDLELKSVLGKEAVLVQSMHFSKGVEMTQLKMSLVNGQLLTLQLTQDMFSQLRTILLKATVNIEDLLKAAAPETAPGKSREKQAAISQNLVKPLH